MTSLRTPEDLKIISWNIAGWASKHQDMEILKFIECHDVICIQETWAMGKILVNRFTVKELPATPSHCKGRPRSGLAIMLSTNLHISLTWYNPCKNLAMACCVTLGSNSTLLVNSYIPPHTSCNVIKQAWSDLEHYISHLEIKCPKAKL